MYGNLIRLLRGTFRFSAENGFPEAFMTACGKEELALLHITATETGFRCSCLLQEYERIKALADRYGVTLTVEKEHGIIRYLRRYKQRLLLPFCLLLAVGLLYFSQEFLWTIEIVGNRTVSAVAIQTVLEEEGLTRMTYLPQYDMRLLREKALLKLPQLSFLTINRHGSRLEVIVAERSIADPLKDEEPCDVIALYDGVIRSMDVYEGRETTGVGYTVTKGEILVHGHYQTKKGNVLLVHADAKVIAEVYFDKTIAIDLTEAKKQYSGEQTVHSSFYFFDWRIPLSFGEETSEAYDTEYTETPFCLFGKEFPFGILQEKRRYYRVLDEKTAKENAEEALRRAFLQYEADELGDHAILSRQEQLIERGDILSMTIRYITECDIAKQTAVTMQEFKDPAENN